MHAARLRHIGTVRDTPAPVVTTALGTNRGGRWPLDPGVKGQEDDAEVKRGD